MKSIYARERRPFSSRAHTFFITMKNFRCGNEAAHRVVGRKTFSGFAWIHNACYRLPKKKAVTGCEASGARGGHCAKSPALGGISVERPARPDGACRARNRPADCRATKNSAPTQMDWASAESSIKMKKKLLSLRSSRVRSFPWAVAVRVCARCSALHRPRRHLSPSLPYLP